MKRLNISTKTVNRFIAMVVAFTMVFTMGFGTPIVIAENGGTESIITNIAGLNDDVAVQHLEVGASENDIVFPSTLDATLETYKDVLVEVVPEIEEVVEEPETTEEVPVEEVTEDTSVIPEEVTETETDAQEETDYEDETTAEEPVVETTEVSEVPETAETIETTTETTPAEESAPDESAPASESTPASEPASEPEPVDPVALIIDTLFPAITAKAAEAGVFAEVSSVTAEVISGETEAETVVAEPTYVVETITTSTDITLTDITWTIDPALSTAPAFDSNIEGATYVYTANIPTEYVINSTLPTITVIIGEATEEDIEFEQSTVVDGVVITVKADKGVFPEGATLTARRATAEEKDTFDNAVENLEGELPVVSSYVFDIKVLNADGVEVKPDTSNGQVYVSFTLEEAADDDLSVNVYHIPNSEYGATEAEKLDADVNGKTVEAETDSFSIYGVTTTATTDVLENDGYPYLVNQNDSSATLAVRVQAGKEEESSYQWVIKTDTGWEKIDNADSREVVLSGSNLVNNAWYACVVNGFDSKAVQLLKAGTGDWKWTYSCSYNWYVSNGQMVYSVDGGGFDVRGKYVKPDGRKYMINTSYNGDAWRIKKQSGAITDLCFKFDEGDSSAVIISAYLNGCNAFSFGTDTMLGDWDFDYADNAALEATLNADNSLHHVSMIGAMSSKPGDFVETDPAFVITPMTHSGLRYWLGSYYERWGSYYYKFNEGGNYNSYYTMSEIAENNKPTVVKVNNQDSAMTMSWVADNLSLVSFKFGVGTIAATGAVGGEVNYTKEIITGLTEGEQYDIDIIDEKTVTVTSTDGTIPLRGNNYDFAGHTIIIRHDGDDPRTLTIAERPSVEDIISTGTQDGGNVARPVDIGTTIISTTTETITIKVDPSLGQQYRLYDENDNPVSEWISGSDGTITFLGLDDKNAYTIKTRRPATNSAPASLESNGVTVTLKTTVSVAQQTNQTIQYDEEQHTYAVVPETENAVITYSTYEYDDYSLTIPTFKNVGTYTVYYKAVKDGYRTTYGSFKVEISKGNRFENNQNTFDEKLILNPDRCVDTIVSLAKYLDGLSEDDVVTLVRQGNSSNNIAVKTGLTGTITDKVLKYSYPGSEEGTTGDLILMVENPNYYPYTIVIPVETADLIQLDLPENNETTAVYDGRPHSYSVTTDDESAIVKYSITPNGELTTTVPSFTEPGTHTVYYTIEREGIAPKTGSYTVTVYPTPKSETGTVTYDGKEHRFPLSVDDKNIKITYSYSSDGEYIDSAPSFAESGEYVVYYKLEQEGHNPVFGSYTVKIDKPVQQNNTETKRNYPPVASILKVEEPVEEANEEKTESYNPDDSIVKELIPELTETEEATTDIEDTLGKGKIIDKGDIWGDMTEETKSKLLEKLEASGGEIIKTANLLDPITTAKAELKAEEKEGELAEDRVPVKETPIALVMGEGAVVVTLELSDNTKANAGLADAKAVAKSILTEEQYAAVAAGSILEIKVELTPLEETAIPELDRQVIDDGVTEYTEQIPNLAMADYIDISMFMRIDDSDWNQLTEVDPIDIVIDIPETHKGLSDTYYIMRAHEGVSTLLEDKDNDSDTITISTGQFSTYALMYDEPQVAVKADFTSTATACKLCHKCPTLFGICYYVWLAMVAAAGISLVLYKSARKQEEE